VIVDLAHASGVTGTILHVDDYPAGRYAVSELLRRRGFVVVEATNGVDTLRLVRQNPDLVLLDVNLPDMSGYEICRLIKSDPATADIPVVHLSSTYITGRDWAAGLEAGADSYLAQPVDEQVIVATIRALLRARRAEKEVQTIAREWQTSFDALGDGVCLLDAEGRIRRCNSAMLELLGLPPDQVIGRVCREVIPGAETWGNDYPFGRTRATLQRSAADLLIGDRWFSVTADPVQTGGVLTSVTLILTDITDRKKYEDELGKLGDALASQLADMTLLHELGARLSTSSASQDLQPLLDEVVAAVAELMNTDMASLMLHDQERGDLYPAASVGLSDEYLGVIERVPLGAGACGRAVANRCSVIVEDAQTDPIITPYHEAASKAGFRAVFCTALISLSGNVIGTVVTYHRVPRRPTEREKRLIELYLRQAIGLIDSRRLYQQAQAAIAIRDQFLASTSHDLKNPLTNAKGHAQILLRQVLRESGSEQTPGHARLTNGLSQIDTAINSAVGLIDELLDIAHLQAGQTMQLNRRPTDLVALARQAIASFAQPNARLHIRLDSRVDRLDGMWDTTRLERVFANLLNNAVKYSPDGGEIVVEIASERDAAGSWAVCSIRDRGLGIPEDELPHIFTQFHRARNVVGRIRGAGIGLAGVRQIVEQHGGAVEIESQEGAGTTVTVRLPLDESVDSP
jgi:PAS domain S-box-containing protein